MSFLSKIFKKKEVTKLVTKPLWAAKCDMKHIDNTGRAYYKFVDELDMPLLRKNEIDKGLMEMRYGSDLDDVLTAMDDSLNEFSGGKIKPNTTQIGFFCKELKDRKKYLIEGETLFKICANTLIREDESPYVVDQTILKEKIETFKNEINEKGLYLFFCKVDLMIYLNLSNISITQFAQMMRLSQNRMTAVRRTINSHSLEQRSAQC
jgi:hypothetical protein